MEPYLRRISYILILLLLPISVHATLEDTWVYSGQSISTSEGTLYVHVAKDYTSIYIQTNGSGILLSQHECRSLAFLKVCYADVAPIDDAEHTRTGVNGLIERAVLVQTEQLGPSLSLQTTSPSVIQPGTAFTVLATVTNTGNRDVENVTLSARMNTTGMTLSGCTPACSWSALQADARIGRLIPGEEENVTFTITPLVYEPGMLNMTVTGTYAGETLMTSASRVFTPQDPVTLTVNATQQEAPAGTPLSWRVDLTNTLAKPVEYAFIISYPPLLSVTHNLTNGTLSPNETRQFIISTSAYYSGTYPLNLTLILPSTHPVLKKDVSLKDVRKTSTLEIIPSTTYSRVISRSEDRLQVRLKNTAGRAFKNITLTLIGFYNTTLHIPRLGINEEKIVLDTPITYPSVSEETTLEETLHAFYRTFFDEEFTKDTTYTITAYPLNESILVERSIQPAHPQLGESFTVTVKARILTDQPLRVTSLNDTLEGALLEEGTRVSRRQPTQNLDVLYTYRAKRTGTPLIITTRAVLYAAGRKTLASWTFQEGESLEETDQSASLMSSGEHSSQENTSLTSENASSTPTQTGGKTPQPPAKQQNESLIGRIISFFLSLFSLG